MQTLPHTQIPSFYPGGVAGGQAVLSVTCNEPRADNAAFANVLRILLGGTGEFAFRQGESTFVRANSLEEGQSSETLQTYNITDVVGHELVEAQLSSADDKSAPINLELPVAFHIEVRGTSVQLAYAQDRVPHPLAQRLLDLYVSKSSSSASQDKAVHSESLTRRVLDFCKSRVVSSSVAPPKAEAFSTINYPPAPYPTATTKHVLLHDGFLEAAAKYSDAIAVDFLSAEGHPVQRSSLSYAELENQSLRLAQVLRGLLGSKTSVVPLALPPSIELYVGYLGVLRSGNAFCPLPGLDNAPASRLVELVQDVAAPIVLGHTPRPEWMAPLTGVVWLDISKLGDLKTDVTSWSSPKCDDLAYVLFTSGSTGKPKGVQIEHLSVSASIASHLAARGLPRDTRWFQFAASTFDPSLMEIFCNFWSGTTVCAADRQRFLTDPEATVRELGCTHMMATPSMAAMLRPEKIGKNFELWTMGEKLSNQVIRAFSRPDDGYVLFNAYGPTEASINVTLRFHPSNESGARLGSPISTASIVILHPNEPKLVPMGFPGELGLHGVQLARGYLDMPEKTAEAFIHVPDIGRVYRTGDRARIVVDAHGEWNCVEYLGRMGMDQVKLSGRRVELGEIDAVLSAAPGIRAAYSAIISEQLYALITPADKDLIEIVENAANTNLPSHMRPVGYYLNDSIPQSTAGKADRKAIARLIQSRLEEERVAGQDEDISDVDTTTLSRVIQLISSISDLDERQISPSASLLSLGIDSLRGVKLLRLLREAGIGSPTIQDLLGTATPASVVRALLESHEQLVDAAPHHDGLIANFVTEATPTVRLELGLSDEDSLPPFLPVTPMQASVLALWLREPTAYLNHSVYHLTPSIDLIRFKAAWNTVVERTPILRTSFAIISHSDISPFAQIVHPRSLADWVDQESSDISKLTEEYLGSVPDRISLQTPWATALLRNQDSTQTRFVLTLHHSLFDGASLAMMLEELFNIYEGSNTQLRREGIEYSVHDALDVDDVASEEYWKKELDGYSQAAFPDLSGLRQHCKTPGHHTSIMTSTISYQQLQDGSRVLETSPLAILQAAWGLLLVTYSEAETPDILFGSIVGGRMTDELEHTVGPVFSAVPIRIRDADTTSTSEMLSQLVGKNASALRHRYPSLKVLSGENGIIYDTTIALQNFAQGTSETDLWSESEYPPMRTEFAVVLEIWIKADNSLTLRATCSNNVLVPPASEVMLHQFDNMLSTILSGTNTNEPLLNIITKIPRELISAVNSTPRTVDTQSRTLIHHEFEQNARQNPNALALWFKQDLDRPEHDLRWTYAEVDASANRIANYIIKSFGDVRDQAIPICMEKCPEIIIAMLGILKAGAAWCPIDFASPDQRKHDLIARAGGPLVIVQNQENFQRLQVVRPDGVEMIAMDDRRLLVCDDEAPIVNVSPSHLAYLIWTSGTTGLPKGVPIEHRAAVQALTVLQEVIPWKETGVRVLNFSANTFDVSILDVFYALGASCGALCTSPKEILVGQFDDAVNAFVATHAFLTPAFMAQWSLMQCLSLEALISIGEKLPDPVADKWCRPGVVSLNTYGPAEATIIATYRRFEPEEATKAQNVGLPLETISCFVIKDGRVVPRGGVGELALGGYQNARGYHRQPDMTAKKFIDHDVAGKVYMTGDVVRILHDGTCEFVGRNDDLVKLGGIRVELSEISTSIKGCDPAVLDVTTMQLSRPDRPRKVICTFLAAPSVPSDKNLCESADAVLLAKAARAQAEQTLPDYMNPTIFLVVKRLPLTPSNKIDRKALAADYASLDINAWEEKNGDVNTGPVEWSVTEQRIRKVVAELTDFAEEQITKTTSFRGLGVDSLRAVQLVSRLRKAGITVTVQDTMNHSTPVRLARHADAQLNAEEPIHAPQSQALKDFEATWRPAVQREIRNVEFVLPCTPLQEGMLGETTKDPTAYWSHRLFALQDSVDVNALEAAWEKAASKIEALRTVFVPAAAYSPFEIIGTDWSPIFIQLVLRNISIQFSTERCLAKDIDRRSKEIAATVMRAWTDSRRPPWSVSIFEDETNCRTMLLDMHHSLYDGDAVDFILEDVQLCYLNKALPRRLQLSSALSASLFAVDPKTSSTFWEETLAPFAEPDAAAWPILLDHTPTIEEAKQFSSRPFDCDRALLSSVASQLNVSISHLLQAAWSIVMSSYMHTDKVVFGETLSLRIGNPTLETAAAPLITTTPVVARVAEDVSVGSLIKDLADLANRSASSRLVSSQKIRKVLQRNLDQPVFPVIFVMYFDTENADGSKLKESEYIWSAPSIATLSVEHPVAINVYASEKTIKVDVLGNGAYMSADHVEVMSRQFEAILRQALAHTDAPIGDILNNLDESLLSVIPSVEKAVPASLTHWLELRAQQTPEQVAITSHEEGAWSFGKLNEASNGVAHWLHAKRDKGVVAVCAPLSIESIIHELGILKSGSTFVSIDSNLRGTCKRLAARAVEATIVLTTADFIETFDQMDDLEVVDFTTSTHRANITSPAAATYQAAPVAVLSLKSSSQKPSTISVLSAESINSVIEGLVDTLPDALPTDTFVAWSPPALGVHLTELLLPIRLGTPIAIVSARELQSDLTATLNLLGTTHALLPSAWIQEQGIELSSMASLRCALLIGGSPPSSAVEHAANQTVLHVVGFNETSGIVSTYRHRQLTLPLVGHPIPQATTCVIHQGSMKTALRGESGELCFGGPSMALGYLRGVKTASIETTHGKLWRTGKRGRMLANGVIQDLGYFDQTIEHHAISEAMSAASSHSIRVHTASLNHPAGVVKYSVSFVSRSWDCMGTTHASISEQDVPLSQTLRRNCDPRMTPDLVIPLTHIPLGVPLSGEVDVRALGRIFASLPVDALRNQVQKTTASRNLTADEEKLRTILSASTGIPEASIQAGTSTLELGIDSLTAISISFKLKTAGFLIPPHIITAGPTLEKLARSSKAKIARETHVIDINVDEEMKKQITGAFDVASVSHVWRSLPMQEGLVARTLNSEAPVYVNHFVLRLTDADPDRLHAAFDATIGSNEILHTCFVSTENHILQVVLDRYESLWMPDSYNDNPLAALREDIPKTEHDIVQNMSTRPPLRLALYTGPDAAYLVLTMHHALYDGESLPMLLAEVRERYSNSFETVRPPPSRLLEYVYSQSQEAAQIFYTEYLQDIVPPQSVSLVGNSLHHETKLGLTLADLERTSRIFKINTHMLLLTAFGVALGEMQAYTDVVVGVVLSGRGVLVDGIESMLAPCITTVPVRVQATETALFVDTAHRVQQETESVFEHQHTPLRLIQRWIGSELFNTLFSFSKSDVTPEHRLWESVESKAVLDYPLALAVEANTTTGEVLLRSGHFSTFANSAKVKKLMLRMEDLLCNPHQRVQGLVKEKARTLAPAYEQEWTDHERTIQRVVAKICRIESKLVCKDTSFLHLGIDSITSIRLAQALREEGIDVPTFAIMQNPCLGALAIFLSSGNAKSVRDEAQREFEALQVALKDTYSDKIVLLSADDSIQTIYPATPLQVGMLTQSISSPELLYTVHHAFQLAPGTSSDRLREAWEKVIQGTDILRSSFTTTDDAQFPWIAAVHGKTSLKWNEHVVESEDEVTKVAKDIEKCVGFNTEEAFEEPPIAFHLISSSQLTVLIAVVHHCLYDGLSFGYIVEDVAAAYKSLAPYPRPQFTAAVPLILYSSRDTEDFWKNRLLGFVAQPLPRIESGFSKVHLAKAGLEMDEDAVESVKAAGVTVQAVALLAWGKVHSTICKSLDIVFGQVVAGRSIELDDALHASGPLFNTIPFRFTLSDPSLTNLEALQAQHELNIQAEPRQHVPLRQIQKDWRMCMATGEALFDTLFVFQQGTEKSEARSSLWSGYRISEEASAQYPLNVEIVHTGKRIEVHAGCKSDVFSQDGLREVLQLFCDAFLDIVRNTDETVVSFPTALSTIAPTQPATTSQQAKADTEAGRDATTTERVLRTVFAEVCNIPEEKVGLGTPLYALGMDSVSAIQIAAKCRGEHGLDVSVTDIFVGETIAGIAAACDAASSSEKVQHKKVEVTVFEEERAKVLKILQTEESAIVDVLPVLAGQRYHLASWLRSGGTFYQPVFAYKVGSGILVDQLRNAWFALQERHSILRTAFAATSEQAVYQVVFQDTHKDSWRIVEGEGEFDACIKQEVKALYGQPSDVSRPPAQAVLVRVGDECALLLSMHHATYDAWSVPHFIADLNALLVNAACKSTVNFSDFVRVIGEKDVDAETAFWGSALEGAKATLLKPKYEDPAPLTQVFARASDVVTNAEGVNAACQAKGTSLQAVALAAWGKIATRMTGVDSPVLGVYHTGRAATFDGLATLAGPCVNVLPMQIPEGDNASSFIQSQLGKRTRFEHSAVGDIVKQLGLTSEPLFNVFVNLMWHGDKIRSVREGGLALENYSVGVPWDYVSHEPFVMNSTVDAMDCSYLPEAGLYADVVLNAQKNSLGVAVRCNETLMRKDELEEIVKLFGQEVGKIVSAL
ncbi:putative peptide synthetase [Cylindrobasidium torrendii FP15055 ss-10]|uniref:Putative peptide synthetase n=1 Tax=Cylindrobasidium torrendii FP15055 ss-10 TaxID=1314674 RepID=A0A0D7BB42_9AGAR|nr:putative peptide synthetase [Cylindrobasidium torrendii FP15055 ss-10]